MNPIAVLLAVLKFFDEVTWFVQILQKTPEEQHQAVIKRIQGAFDESANGGRPGVI